jgi:hypothetical protein
MAGALMGFMPVLFEDSQPLSYFFENWNSDVLSIGCVLVGILMLAGYFYGRLLEHFVPALKKADTTFLGIFLILGVFEIYTFYAANEKSTMEGAVTFLKILISAGPIACLLTRSNVVPKWRNLVSPLLGIFIALSLGKVSAQLTTNNIFYDSVYYLSEVVETANGTGAGAIYYYSGISQGLVEPLHGFEGYYYFWGILLRWVNQVMEPATDSLTPVFIWGASVLYYMSLGNLLVSSVNVLYKKHKWFGLIVAFLLVSPFFVNYFNTTLAFFGNTLRTVIVGWGMLLAYVYIKSHDPWIFLPLGLTVYAGLASSSSAMFIFAFLMAGLFFSMGFSKKTTWKDYFGLVMSCAGIFHMAAVIIQPSDNTIYSKGLLITIGALTVLGLVSWLLRNHVDGLSKVVKVLFPLVLAGLIIVSYQLKDSEYGYAFYYESRSLHDMCLNYTSHVSSQEHVRNIVMYLFCALLAANYKMEKKFKLFLVFIAVLFLNPLTEPAVANYLTSVAYCRSFDLLANPFTLTFLVYNADCLLTPVYAGWVLLPVFGMCALMGLTLPTMKGPYDTLLTFQMDVIDWKYKVTDETMDMYQYIQEKIIPEQEGRYSFLSQDVSLKAYVPNVIVPFPANEFREAYESEEAFQQNELMMTLLFPMKLTSANEISDPDGNLAPADYSRFDELVDQYDPDFILMRNTIAIWNERGWYEKAYVSLTVTGRCSVEYENTEWVLLRVDHDYVAAEEVEAESEVESMEEADE